MVSVVLLIIHELTTPRTVNQQQTARIDQLSLIRTLTQPNSLTADLQG